MKKITLISLGFIATLLLLGACSGKTQDVVTTDEGNITKDALYDAMKAEVGEDVLTQLTYEKILEKKYKVSDEEIKQKLSEYKNQGEDKYQDILKQSNQTEETLKKNLRYRLLLEKAIEANYKIEDKDLKAYYANWQPGIEVRHILFSNETSAKEGQQKLKEGESFEKLVDEYSIDPTTKANGGLMESLTSGMVDPAFETAAFELKKAGDTSGIIQSAFGYHLIQLVKPSSKASFEKDKNQVKSDYVKATIDEKTKTKILKEEAEKAHLKVKDSFFNDSFR